MENLGSPAAVAANDFTGTVAAARWVGGSRSFQDYLVTREYMSQDEAVVGIEFYLGEILQPNRSRTAQLSVGVTRLSSISLRRGFRLGMDAEEFFKFFPQFCIRLIRGNFELIRGTDLPVAYDES